MSWQFLREAFDHMKEEIGRLIEDIRQEQNQRRVMELQLLRSRLILISSITPWIPLCGWQRGQNRAVVDMVYLPVRIFRTTLSGGKDFITMREEIGHIKSYLQIQKIPIPGYHGL